MTRCRFCAEEIQDAAIVCKHCRRDLVPARATTPTRWGRVLLVIVGLIGAGVAMLYFGEDHQRFLAWETQRDAWHRKCDVYRERPLSDPAVRACNEELGALMEYAKRQGWH